jgi:hypothetical protein
MPRVIVQIIPDDDGEPKVFIGRIVDVHQFRKGISPLADWRASHSPTPSRSPLRPNRKPEAGKKGIFRAVYRVADPSTDREFAALVAVYMHSHLDRMTRSRDVERLAGVVKRKISNASMAIKQALHAGDVKEIRVGTPTTYAPTMQAIDTWTPFVHKAEKGGAK